MSKHLVEDEALVGESSLPFDFDKRIEWLIYMFQMKLASIRNQVDELERMVNKYNDWIRDTKEKKDGA